MSEQLYETAKLNLTAAVVAVGTVEVGRFNQMNMIVTGLAAETISLTGSTDGGVTYSSTNIACSEIATPTTIITALTNATYFLPWMYACPFTHIKITKSAGVSTVVCRIMLRQS